MAGEWTRAPLRDLIEFTRDGEWGSDQPTSDTVEMLVIRGTDFARFRVGALAEIPRRHIERGAAERKQLRPGDVLIETAGGTKDQSTGRTALVKYSHIERAGIPLTCASFARFLRFDGDKVDSGFIYWWLQSLHVSGEMETHQVQHTGVARFQFTKFVETIRALLPALPEQRAIAHVLGTLDDKIELNRRMNETLETMARALFKSWFVDFDPVRAKAESRDTGLPKPLAALFPDRFKDSELGEVPAGWEVKTIGDLAEVVGGSTPRTSEAAYWDAGVHYWATPKDLSALTVPVLLETERRSLTLASHRSARDSCLLGQSSFRRVLRSVTGLSPKCPSRSIRASSP
jgi:type I restriction enzyme S subunit